MMLGPLKKARTWAGTHQGEGRRRRGGEEEGVMVAATNHLTSVVTSEGAKIHSLEETEGRIAGSLIKCKTRSKNMSYVSMKE